RVGAGWAITVDLPATRKATDVIKNREALASALAVDEVQLIVERGRGNGGHARRGAVGGADGDPEAAPPGRTPPPGGGRGGCRRWNGGMPGGRSRPGGTHGTGRSICRWSGRRCWLARFRGRARRSRLGWRPPG